MKPEKCLFEGNLEVDVYGMSGEKDNWGRVDKLRSWFTEGGVLIIGTTTLTGYFPAPSFH